MRLDIRYDGTAFSGWAKQPGLRTVQGVLDDALAKHPPGAALARAIVVAGRTDAGVHATGQVAHIDVEPAEPGDTFSGLTVDSWGVPELDRVCHRWNRFLPGDIRVTGLTVAPKGFDARFSAIRRHYRYRVSDAKWGVDPLRRADTLAWHHTLDVERMNRASAALIGLHDFAAFCKQRAGATTIRELQDLTWRRVSEDVLEAHVAADAFCHSMVRSLVGALLLVGDGRRGVEWPGAMLARGERCSAVAPPHGLTLTEVEYPDSSELEAQATRTRRRRTPDDHAVS
ncbi:tRNA pseudouridine(38-40) synthase TruA [Haloechinothrix sp. LS1_15]|uniref:tRNA pseudouridine(38-40) synthase TruA n=1 Tax=Haloechinothrix sp. LS1_15 TaxID=2652248 RepID=UPI002946443E|nr:tRNA pseudouridine(38-40) synthase TruA [Haloechinothrix sp. LS1_15]MDV6013099.1 tRNA pseudouridine(38-40) synthase TruA [Haloechinothrix sp. LS1_15]